MFDIYGSISVVPNHLLFVAPFLKLSTLVAPCSAKVQGRLKLAHYFQATSSWITSPRQRPDYFQPTCGPRITSRGPRLGTTGIDEEDETITITSIVNQTMQQVSTIQNGFEVNDGEV